MHPSMWCILFGIASHDVGGWLWQTNLSATQAHGWHGPDAPTTMIIITIIIVIIVNVFLE